MKSRVPEPSPEYLGFLKVYGSRISDLTLEVRKLVLSEAPASTELIYDAYNAVAAGYSFTGRPSDAFIHIATYARWVNLGFNQGSQLPDPDRLLQGSGNWIRHIRISAPEDLHNPAVRAFVKAAVSRADRPEADAVAHPGKSVVRAIYPTRRRPRKNPDAT